jgi:hypothetical protein
MQTTRREFLGLTVGGAGVMATASKRLVTSRLRTQANGTLSNERNSR